jgi:hypothetical protein
MKHQIIGRISLKIGIRMVKYSDNAPTFYKGTILLTHAALKIPPAFSRGVQLLVRPPSVEIQASSLSAALGSPCCTLVNNSVASLMLSHEDCAADESINFISP